MSQPTPTIPATPPTSPSPGAQRRVPDASPDDSHLLAFLAGRSVPCPRCAYDLRDIQAAKCPECGEPLVLKVGSPRVRFGWLVLAMAPGCFSGVAAAFVLIPIFGTLWAGGSIGGPGSGGLPLPVLFADAFGFLSAASVVLMYRQRHRIMALPTQRQGIFAAIIWGIHILAFGLFLLSMWLLA